MKRIFFLLLLSTAVIGCKSTSVTNTKLDNKTERMLKGNWTIASVYFSGSDYLKVNSFNLEDSSCFIGSDWSFVSNNNKGEMSLNNPSTDCKGFSSPITWYVNKDGNFVLKIINNHKAKDVNTGYILKLNNVTETSFELIDKINVAGQVKDITYTFQRQ
ncbi:lipocalin family protein [Tenacibaculum caenipelagi]|uniref:Lipocalin-like protein n=1 Tax=Tenacibaculum caenipelagi TaxID=1325435 RepID=A0A4R6TJW0_9FLAO|nr:lipocalin family protein [Tenacibaculum caenipelagi]TDQ29788.1 lipocalin-like protein [Tenacibaculum caenipelagi]